MTAARRAGIAGIWLAWLGVLAAVALGWEPVAALGVGVGTGMLPLAAHAYLSPSPAGLAPAGPTHRERHRAELDEWLWDFRLAAAYAPLPGDHDHLHRYTRDGYRGGPPASLRPDGTLYVRVPTAPASSSTGHGERVTIHTADGRLVRDYGPPLPPPAPPPVSVAWETR